MKTDLFFEDIKNKDNIILIETVDNKVKEEILRRNIHNIKTNSFMNSLQDVVELL